MSFLRMYKPALRRSALRAEALPARPLIPTAARHSARCHLHHVVNVA
jgi:hypothetical protein